MIDIALMDVEDILADYNEIKPEIEKALVFSSGEWTANQIIRNAIAEPNLFQIWYVYDEGERIAIASTRILNYPNFNSIHIITLGGRTNNKFKEWTEEFLDIMKEYPHIDCVEFTGRRALVKRLEDYGWKERYTTMRIATRDSFKV